ncbi:hypothetical protein OE88DRAFT_1502449 [Heliocybe sulcata]|uniref:Uncharacterized protein n=1 Tax=Heliocybe sulcata TaxID=5364 RepID=A0A5C3N7Q7_9AGAM|nr:hypothetical protein OE88DRAFT_1502449 [Heliocybe sulcata]
MPSPTTPSRRRSRDRLPSPKPAPSSLLPPVPSRRHLRPLNLPSTRPPAPPAPASPSVSSHSHSHSAPSILSPSSASFLLSPRTSFLPSFPTPRRSRTQDSASASTTKRESIASSSLTRGASVTSHQRRANRSNALACLEGRACNPHRISRTKTNFMSLSDDEDDAEADDEIADFVQEKAPSQRDSIHLHEAMLLEDEDVVIPASPRCSGRLRSHSRAQAPKIRSRANTLLLSITVPDAATSPSKKPRSRSGTLESWFPPFADFIDFADDEASKWRSFVEVGSP